MTPLHLTPPRRILDVQCQQLQNLPQIPLEEQVQRLNWACQNLKTTRDAEYFLKLPSRSIVQHHARDRILKVKEAHRLLMAAQHQAALALEILRSL